MRVLKRILPGTATAITLATLTACDTPGVTLVDPDVSAAPDSVTFIVRLEDSTLVAALGWTGGVPGAVIMLHRIGDDFHPDSLLTDSTGNVSVHGVLPGYYRVAAHRVLSESETTRVGGHALAFGTGSKFQLSASGTITLTVEASNRGSLVFSEIYAVQQWLANHYQWFQYIELYNNGDTVVYLDGMILGKTWHLDRDYPPYPCSTTEAMRNDSAGVWALFFHRFPGGGHDYPVDPGRTITVAQDAVDHSVVHSSFPDLTNADFELEGTADADNPDVPNMPDVGLRPSLRGHGLDMIARATYFLSGSIELGTLHRVRDSATGNEWVRFPAHSVLDVVSLHNGSAYSDAQYTPCRVSVHPSFDELEGGFLNTSMDTTLSFHRRILPAFGGTTTPILHDVNTSFIDVVTGPHSPGEIRH
jgi:hypothetical protein